MEWNQSLSVNVRMLDDQHKKLVDLINQLQDAMKRGAGNEALGAVLQSLINYTATHFSTEEKMMKSYAYPDIANHKALHEKLVREVLDLQVNFKNGKTLLTLKVMKFLKDWLVKHIQGEDKKYTPFFNAKGIT